MHARGLDSSVQLKADRNPARCLDATLVVFQCADQARLKCTWAHFAAWMRLVDQPDWSWPGGIVVMAAHTWARSWRRLRLTEALACREGTARQNMSQAGPTGGCIMR